MIHKVPQASCSGRPVAKSTLLVNPDTERQALDVRKFVESEVRRHAEGCRLELLDQGLNPTGVVEVVDRGLLHVYEISMEALHTPGTAEQVAQEGGEA